MKKIIIVFLLVQMCLHAQQIPLYSSYYLNSYLYNPSMAGFSDHTNIFLTHCIQWTDFQGAPVTSALTIDGPVKQKNIGLGLNVFNDVTDISRRLGAYGSYSYKLNINEDNILMMGLSLGIVDSYIDFSKVVVKDYSDPFLLNQNQRKATVDANIGFTYIRKDFQVGLAVPQLMANSIKYSDNNARGYYNLSRHYLFSFKYSLAISDEKKVRLEPLVLIRTVSGAPAQYDLNFILSWNNKAWFNLSYKSDYAVGVSAAINVCNGFKVGYAYDFITSPLNIYAGVSNQVMLSYTISSPKDSVDFRYKNQQERISKLEHKAKLNESEHEFLKAQIENLQLEIETTRMEIISLQKKDGDSVKSTELLNTRLQVLEDKLKLIISTMGE